MSWVPGNDDGEAIQDNDMPLSSPLLGTLARTGTSARLVLVFFRLSEAVAH